MGGAVQRERCNTRDSSGLRIMSVQLDREHAFVEVIGPFDHEGVAELGQRIEGLLIAGARYVLVDLTGACGIAPTTSAALAPVDRQLARRKGWLRMIGHDSSTSAARYEASLPDLFVMYRAAVRTGTAGGNGHGSGRGDGH